MKKIAAFIFLVVSCLITLAQNDNIQRHYCYTDELWAQMVHHDSSLLQKKIQMDAIIAQYSNSHVAALGGNEKSGSSVPSVVIPTVFYVVYDSASVNISMAQIQSQMDQLNQNFADYGYSFCYAKRNVVSGSLFTPQAGDSAGVFRINSPLSNVNASTTDAQLKALSSLPPANYLRIFIVHTITPAGVLGYTVWPGSNAAQDGIVVLSSVCGSNNFCNACQLYPSYNLGAALTHEAGHFLDLYHTFQGGCDTGSGVGACQLFGDQVCDTPPTDGSFGCPNQAPLSCDGIRAELIQNYMDYTDDPCKNSFTAGQKARMDFATNVYHQVLVSTANLVNTGVTCVQIGNQYADFYCQNFDGCLNAPMTFASLGSAGFVYTWNFGDGNSTTGDTVQHTYTHAGQFQVTLSAVNSGQNVSVTRTTPVFVTECIPTNCSMNKWNCEYAYLDFSTGTPIAINHASAFGGMNIFADYYSLFYRGDTSGNPLFSVGFRITNPNIQWGTPLLDTFFVVTDSLVDSMTNTFMTLTPVPGRPNTFCLVENFYHGINIDSLVYSIISVQNGAPHVIPGKRLIHLPFPAGTPAASDYVVAAIPNCDGTKFWIIAHAHGSPFWVFESDSTETVTYHQTFSAPDSSSFYRLIASPNGRMIALETQNPSTYGLNYLSFDKASGLITNYTQLFAAPNLNGPSFSSPIPCFSPNSRYLYYSEVVCNTQSGTNGTFYQSDMFNPNPYATRKTIYHYPTDLNVFGPEQSPRIGPDEKLYIGSSYSQGNNLLSYRLGVINYPNVMENGLNSTGYNANGPDIKPVNCPFSDINAQGFAGFSDLHDAFDCHWQPGVPTPFSYVANGCLSYQFYFDECYDAQWNFGDPASSANNTSVLVSPAHIFSRPGVYIVKLLANGYTFADTINITAPYVQIASTPIGPCPSPIANYSIADVQPFVNYIWTVSNGIPSNVQGQNNINVQWNTDDTTGTITVIAIDTVMGCTDTATLNVNYSLSDSITVNNIYASICSGSSYVFGNRVLTSPGNYSDTVYGTAGCISITRLKLTIDVLAGVSWAGGTDTINPYTGGIALTGGSPSGGVYSGIGVSGNTFYPDSAALGSYTITYTYTDSTGCSGSANRVFVVLGISDLNIENEIHLFPNPANSIVVAQSELFSSSNVLIQLFDVTGQLIILPVEKSTDRQIFNVSQLANGVYCFKFFINGHEIAKRFVKME